MMAPVAFLYGEFGRSACVYCNPEGKVNSAAPPPCVWLAHPTFMCGMMLVYVVVLLLVLWVVFVCGCWCMLYVIC